MDSKDPKELIEKYLNGTATPEEIRVLESVYNRYAAEQDRLPSPQEIQEARLRNRRAILERLGQSQTRRLLPVWINWWTTAAAILLISATAVYLLREPVKPSLPEMVNDVQPGSNRAVLTLVNGQTLVLDSTQNGIIVDSRSIRYTDGTKIEAPAENSATVAFNTLKTPVGGQYQVILPDGTKVWLNAQSTLKYPNRFADHKREVSVKGEAYFQVADDPLKYFTIHTDRQTVSVLGTELNINDYSDQSVAITTLVAGKVRVVGLANPQIGTDLIPGKEAVVQGNRITTREADIETVTAWKSGEFRFNEDLRSIMDKVARWYDVKMEYEFEPDTLIRYYATVSRDTPLSAVLTAIEASSDIHFKVKGRRVTVSR